MEIHVNNKYIVSILKVHIKLSECDKTYYTKIKYTNIIITLEELSCIRYKPFEHRFQCIFAGYYDTSRVPNRGHTRICRRR